jgi:hypothetical protein
MSTKALNLFYSYSHYDEVLRDELDQHLKPLEHEEIISGWHDRKIMPGDEWNHQISSYLENADIILLLISSDFMASKYCLEIEVQRAMELHNLGKACVVPIILRSADFSKAPFSKLQGLPKDLNPITLQPNRDEAFNLITQEIRKVAERMLAQKNQEPRCKQTSYETALFVSEPYAPSGRESILEGIEGNPDLRNSKPTTPTLNKRLSAIIVMILLIVFILVGNLLENPFKTNHTFSLKYQTCIGSAIYRNYDEILDTCREVYESCKINAARSEICVDVLGEFPQIIKDIEILKKMD